MARPTTWALALMFLSAGAAVAQQQQTGATSGGAMAACMQGRGYTGG